VRGRVRLRVRVAVPVRLRVRARAFASACVGASARASARARARARACACECACVPRATRYTPRATVCVLMKVARGGGGLRLRTAVALRVLRAARCRVGALGCSTRAALAGFNLPGLTGSWAQLWGPISGPSLGGRRAVALPCATDRRPPESGPEVGPGIGSAIWPGSARAGGQAALHAERVCERCGCSSSAGAVGCWWLGPRQRQAVGGRSGECGCVFGPRSASSGSGRNRGRDERSALQRCVALPAAVPGRSLAEPAWFADIYKLQQQVDRRTPWVVLCLRGLPRCRRARRLLFSMSSRKWGKSVRHVRQELIYELPAAAQVFGVWGTGRASVQNAKKFCRSAVRNLVEGDKPPQSHCCPGCDEPVGLVTTASSHGMVPSSWCDAGVLVFCLEHFALSLWLWLWRTAGHSVSKGRSRGDCSRARSNWPAASSTTFSEVV